MPATINGNVLAITGSGVALAIKIESSSSAPVVTESGSVVARQTRHIRSDADGNFTCALAPGWYHFTFGGGPRVQIQVTETSGTYDFTDLIDDNVVTPTPVTPTPNPSYLPASQEDDEVFIVNGHLYMRNPDSGQYHRVSGVVSGGAFSLSIDSSGTETPT
jgi:hypothetical protein